ncbi:response regulator receiver protein [Halothece sp. PCC 7418]|uniref:response regulator n=1 Tax=Halothece sp. (strain PCC 7418) TaxID=65093 RepID=UPI0002A05E4E|nr:response regulator [Halothece sp. PCC 7418]AFZ43690.1 response regulator receiver protein [Halothece sp. PCC 7418]
MVSIEEQRLTCNRIFRYLTYHSQKQFTGRLDVQAASGQSWQVYLNLGQLGWVAGGLHPHRRFIRQLQIAGLEDAVLQKVSQYSLSASEQPECIEYHLLAKLAQEKYLSADQVIKVIKGALIEGLFDVVQATELASPTLQEFFTQQAEQKLTTVADLEGAGDSFYVQVKENSRPSQQARLPYTWMQPVMDIQREVQKSWEHWLGMGLQKYSPNAAPIVKSPEGLQAQTSEKIYKNLMSLMQGKETLRDLAARMKRDIWAMTQVLQPLIHQQIIGFVEIEDLSLFSESEGISERRTRNPSDQTSTEKKGLIACVDDSPQTQKMIETIAQALGYKFLPIYESVEALPTLIEKKPRLIFLDLVMPVVNGYELAHQIRRVESLKDTPVIILTGNMVDRVRARMSGASECITKPVEVDKVRAVLNRYIINQEVPTQ